MEHLICHVSHTANSLWNISVAFLSRTCVTFLSFYIILTIKTYSLIQIHSSNTKAVFTNTHPTTILSIIYKTIFSVQLSFIYIHEKLVRDICACLCFRPPRRTPSVRSENIRKAGFCSPHMQLSAEQHPSNSSHFKTLSVSVWFMGLRGRDFPLLWLGPQRVTVGCAGWGWWMSPLGQRQHYVCADRMWGVVSSRTCLHWSIGCLKFWRCLWCKQCRS